MNETNQVPNHFQDTKRVTQPAWSPLRWTALLLVIAIIAGVLAWFRPASTGSAIAVRRILLISMDTCRADRLRCYGFHRGTTPNIDNVALDGTLFTHAFSPTPMTLPAHSTMLTGTIPPYHGVHDNLGYKLAPDNVTLAQILKDQGFATGGFVGTFVLSRDTGIHRGFDTYDDHFEVYESAIHNTERKGIQVSRLGIQWLEQHKDDEKFFLFLHYYDPHANYDAPEPFASDFAEEPYSAEVAYTDHCVGLVIQKLKDLGLYDSTLIVITSDHGEMLGEHGEATHTYFIYQNALRVPLIIKPPLVRSRGASQPLKPRAVEGPVGIVDIVPTICGLMGIPSPPAVRGVDLSPALFGTPPSSERHLYCESLTPTKYKANSLLGVVTKGWKYIQTTRPELYNLTTDPGELNNLAQVKPHKARVLQDQLRQILDDQLRHLDTSKTTVSEETTRGLGALGYVSGAVDEALDFDQTKEDPKDLIELHAIHGVVTVFLSNGKYDSAKRECEKLLTLRPDFVPGIVMMARINLDMQRPEAALANATLAVELDPAHYRALYSRGLALEALDRRAEAIDCFEQALEISPTFNEANTALGQALAAQGMMEDAIHQFRKALDTNPRNADVHNSLGSALWKMGQTEKALAHLKQALQFNPNFAHPHFKIAKILSAKGQHEEAIHEYRQALAISPDMADAYYNLAMELIQLERHTDAIASLQSHIQLKPKHSQAYLNLGVAYRLAARSGDAHIAFQQAAELDPSGPIGQKALEYIKILESENEGDEQAPTG